MVQQHPSRLANASELRVNRGQPRGASQPVAQGRGSGVRDFLSGLAVLLSGIAFVMSGFAAMQFLGMRQQMASNQQPGVATQQAGLLGNPGGLLPRFNRPAQNPVAPQTSELIKPIYDGAGEVELVSIRRAANQEGFGERIEANLRVRRTDVQAEADSLFDPAAINAVNSRTNAVYPVINFQTPNGGAIALYNMQPGEVADMTVTMRVADGLEQISLELPGDAIFNNVDIAENPNAIADEQ